MPDEAQDISTVLFAKEKLDARIRELGSELAETYRCRAPLVLSVLKGSIVFCADLIRAIEPCPRGLQLDFLTAQSYGDKQVSSGKIEVQNWCSTDLTGRHVLLIDDVCDTGLTLKHVTESLKPQCASLQTVVLLDKRYRRTTAFAPDYVGFKCPDEFVVGYGMDYAQRYRSLPYVGILKPAAIRTNIRNGEGN